VQDDGGSGSLSGAPQGDGGPILNHDAGTTGCGSGLPTSSPDFQKLVSSCVEAVNCDPFLFPVNMSDCITDNFLPAFASVACLANKTDCDGYYQCTGERTAYPKECPTGPSGACTGTTSQIAITCYDPTTGNPYTGVVQNCDALGGTCKTHVDDVGVDPVADCMVVPTCTETDTNMHCNGNKVYECIDGVGYGQDCSKIGSTCQTDSTGSASCFFNSPSCSTPGASCSSQTTLNECTTDMHSFGFDCSRAGLTCQPDGMTSSACVAPGCSPPSTSKVDCTEKCTGTTAHICIGGATFTIDCLAAGFDSCHEDMTDGYAFCVYQQGAAAH
jgi:hypothetical protein